MFAVALAFCAGAALVPALPALPSAAWLFAAALLALTWLPRWPWIAASCVGAAWTALVASNLLGAGWPCSQDREASALTGIVAAPALVREGRTDFDLAVSGRDLQGRVRLSWYQATAVPRPGERWRLTARLRCRQGLANPGAADREFQLLRERVVATGYVVDAERAQSFGFDTRRQPIERLRARVAEGIAKSLPPGPSVAVLQGLSVGVRGAVPDTLWDAFAATGVAHLMAISGLHVTGCAVFVLLLLRAAWRALRLAGMRARVTIELSVVIVTTAGYALLSGASLPALRTLAMVAIVALQRQLRRTLPVHRTLALAAFALCVVDPLALTSAGFWLSFVATAALFCVVTGGRGWRERMAQFARVQLAIFAMLMPVSAVVFGRLSLVAPFVNAVAIPVFSVALLPAVLGSTAFEMLAPDSASDVWRALARVLDGTWPVLLAVANWPGADWAPAAQPVVLIAGAGLLALTALLLPIRGLRTAAAVLLLVLATGSGARPAANAWTLTVLDVGQGLAAVVETQRHVLVFDTGPAWRGGGTAARVSLVPYLRARGIRRIDRLIVSHPDLDHSGGVDLLRNTFDVRDILRHAGESGATSSGGCRRGDGWRWDGVDFQVLHPPYGQQGSDNDRSCALRVSGPGGAGLLLADPEAAAEQSLGALQLAADVVLLPHHGSKSSSSEGLIRAVSARLGIASAGYGNRWGMPVGAVVARWRAAGTTVLTTAESGAVTVRFAARKRPIEVRTERGDVRRWWRRQGAR